MPRRNLRFFAMLLFVPLTLAKDKPQLPRLVANAKYVFVTTYAGDELSNPRVTSDDRQAVTNVQDAIKDWGRYIVVYRPKDADLLIVVRKGGIVEARPGVRIHAGSSPPSPSVGPNVLADGGDPQDMISVYDEAHGIDSPPLWRGRQLDGLNPPDMQLVKQLRSKVEAAAKVP